jgi:thiamine biosynthesis protein ThiS
MRVSLGGKDTEIKDGLTLQELIDSRSLPGRVLIELNGSLVKAEQWSHTRLNPGDVIEMVQVVVGG